MGKPNRGAVLRPIHTLFSVGVVRELSDGQLLERFSQEDGDAAEAAFGVLVERHGPLVLRVCKSVLDDEADAHDAFQATFLILLRKARGLWARESLGPWLFEVARRTAMHARTTAARRRRHERLAARIATDTVAEPADELCAIVHEEIARLPERLRAAVVLCDLEGCSHEQASRNLGWPMGTVKSRLSRARQRLGERLKRRGFEPGPGQGLILPPGSSSSVPVALAQAAVQAMLQQSRAKALAGGAAAALARGVLTSMTITRLCKIAVAGSILCLGVGVGAGGLIAIGGVQKPGPDHTPGRALTGRDEQTTKAAKPGGKTPQADGIPLFVTVEMTGLEQRLDLTGNLAAGRTRYAQSGVEGTNRILWLIEEGTRVKQGDVVARLDARPLRERLTPQSARARSAEAGFASARLSRETAERALADYQESLARNEQHLLDARAQQARRIMDSSKAWLDRVSEIEGQAQGLIGGRDRQATLAELKAAVEIGASLEQARKEHDLNRLAHEQAQIKKDEFEKILRPRKIRELEAAVRKARGDEITRQSALEIESAREKKLLAQVEACKVTSPGDGIVVHANDPDRPSKINIAQGATVRERQIIAFIQDVDHAPPVVKVKLPEYAVRQVHESNAVELEIQQREGIFRTTGHVSEIAPVPDPTNIFSDKRKFYSTTIAIEKPPAKFRPGQKVQASIVLRKKRALAVPRTAVDSVGDDGGGYQVAVRKGDGELEWRAVKLGDSGSGISEILEGLREGDRVLANPIRKLDVPPTCDLRVAKDHVPSHPK